MIEITDISIIELMYIINSIVNGILIIWMVAESNMKKIDINAISNSVNVISRTPISMYYSQRNDGNDGSNNHRDIPYGQTRHSIPRFY